MTYTEDDERLIAEALHARGGVTWSSAIQDAHNVLDALAGAGRLLPEGTQRFTEWGVRWSDGTTWPYRSAEHDARQVASDPKRSRPGYAAELVRRESFYVPPTPWVPASEEKPEPALRHPKAVRALEER